MEKQRGGVNLVGCHRECFLAKETLPQLGLIWTDVAFKVLPIQPDCLGKCLIVDWVADVVLMAIACYCQEVRFLTSWLLSAQRDEMTWTDVASDVCFLHPIGLQPPKR